MCNLLIILFHDPKHIYTSQFAGMSGCTNMIVMQSVLSAELMLKMIRTAKTENAKLNM